jgi:hypothetical protein
VTPHEISGWLYGGDHDLRGRKVLAMLEQTCVGAGEIKEFRQDLADAGLGDGFHGFRFEITPPERKRLGSIVIRLEGDETIMIQGDSRIVGRFDPPEPTAGFAGQRDRGPLLQWMRARQWLDQMQFDFLWYLDQLGIYSRVLTGEEQAQLAERDEDSIADELLELYHMAEIVRARDMVQTSDQFDQLLRRTVLTETLEPVVAVWAATPGRIRAIEGSHRDTSLRRGGATDGAPFTNYVIGRNTLLFVNARCEIEGIQGALNATVFRASGLRS